MLSKRELKKIKSSNVYMVLKLYRINVNLKFQKIQNGLSETAVGEKAERIRDSELSKKPDLKG